MLSKKLDTHKYMMKRIISILLFAFFLFTASSYGDKAFGWDNYIAQTLTLYVNRITPANILYASKKPDSTDNQLAIHFYGIGIPTTKQPFGDEAHAFLLDLLPKNAKIIVTVVGEFEEGILNALVQYKDHSVNNQLVNEGLAWVERSSCKAFFCRRWYIQEHIALKDKRGIWSLNSTRTPWQWSE